MNGWTLLISPIVPDAKGNGLARRAWMWANELSRGTELVILVVGQGDDIAVPGLPSGRLVFVPQVARRAKWKKAIGWLSPDLTAIRDVSDKFPAGTPDRVFVFRLGVSDALAGLPASWLDRIEVDLDDWESDRCLSLARLALRSGSLFRAVQFAAGASFYRGRERRALERFGVVHVSAADDAAVLQARFPQSEICVTPNRIAGPPCPLPERSVDGQPLILFVGTLGYLPNRDAVDWLMGGIQPRLASALPGLRVTVAGDAPQRTAARLKASALDWRGHVPDLRNLYEEATIAIAPLRGGSGTKIKVLEAWLYKRAVVATSHAVRGLGVVPGQHVLVADTTEEMVDACRRLVDDHSLRERIAAEGHRLLQSDYLI